MTVLSALSFYLLANKLSSAIFILPPGLQDSCRVSLIKEKCHVPQNLPDRRFRLYLSRFLRFAAVDRAGWYARKCGLWLYQYVFKADLKIPCEYCLVLFDAKRQNFRNDIFPDYKGTRKEIPEDLIPQFSIIREAVEALNLNHLEMEGYEADDLIATYANMALAQGLEVVIVSGDKDLMQLIRPGVEFYDPMKDKFFSPEDVKEKFGVYPEQVVDVQALAGDTTDNIPGIPGIGLKTAAQLVNDFGSLEGVLTKAGEIKQNKRRETILANIENARISLQLERCVATFPSTIGLPNTNVCLPKWQNLTAS